MRFHLVTVEGAQQFEDMWTIEPLVRLESLSENGPALMMPMADDEIELSLPDGQVVAGHIVSFGMSVWQDSEGNFYTNVDPADPSLTLTIRCDSSLAAVPPGTEIWLPHAKTASS